ncbi:MAG: cation:proton antiporter, partial [Bacteroidota bacterium]
LDETEKSFFSELVFILSTYFFVYVGISMKFGSWGIFAIALFIVLAVMAVRPFSVAWFVRTPMPLKDLSIMGVMAPKGLVPAILATLPIQYGIAGGETIRDLAYAVVLSSIVIGALVVLLISKDWWPLPYPGGLLARRSLEHQQEIEVAAESTATAPEASADPGTMPADAPPSDAQAPPPDNDSTTTTE